MDIYGISWILMGGQFCAARVTCLTHRKFLFALVFVFALNGNKLGIVAMSDKSKFLQLTEAPPPNCPFGSEVDTPILFHYTGFDTLISIANSKELWATNIHYLNDQEEFKNAFSITKALINNEKKKHGNKADHFFDKVLKEIHGIEKLNVHIVSFTANGDLLSQWRAYCPKGGVSIGFRYNDLKTLAKRNNFEVRKCIYDETIKREILQEVIDIHLEFLEEGEPIQNLTKGFIAILAKVAPCFKNQAFEEEQEWRLISDLVSVKNKNIGIRATADTMFPYYRFDLNGLEDIKSKRNLSFDRYVIGPSAHSNLSSDAFGYFLNKYDLHLDVIVNSNIPYRTF